MDGSKRKKEAETGPLPGDVNGQQPIETQQPQAPTQVPIPDQAQIQQAPTMAPTPSNPFAPPQPGMIPLAWGFPNQSPMGQVMQHGDVNQVEDVNMQTPAVTQEEMEVVEEYRKWKKNNKLKEEVPAPVVPQEPNLAEPQVPYQDEEVDMDMDISGEMGEESMEDDSLLDELGDVVVDINRIFKDAGGVLPEEEFIDDEMMMDDELVGGDEMMDDELVGDEEMAPTSQIAPAMIERVDRLKKKIAEARKKAKEYKEEDDEEESFEERIANIKKKIAEKKKACGPKKKEERIAAIKARIAEKKSSVSTREERIAALKEKIAARKREASLDPKGISIKFPAGTTEPTVSPDAAGMAMDGLFARDDFMESAKDRASKRRKLIAEIAARREAKEAAGQPSKDAAEEMEDYDAIHTPGIDKPVTRKDLGESRIAKEKVMTPEMMVARYKEKSEFSFNELIKQGFLG